MALGLLNRGKLLECLGDDVQTLPQLRLGNHQRRRKADDVSVRGLGLCNSLASHH